jgi:hypothetical protein
MAVKRRISLKIKRTKAMQIRENEFILMGQRKQGMDKSTDGFVGNNISILY